MIKKQIDVRQFDLNFQESNGLHDLEIQQFTTKNQQGNTRSFNFKMFLNNVSHLKHIQLTKHMHTKYIPQCHVLYNTVEFYRFE